jgi:hypothetical protein
VLDDSDLGIAKDGKELVGLYIGMAVDRDRRISGAPQFSRWSRRGFGRRLRKRPARRSLIHGRRSDMWKM